jgi:hypothetical protein
MAEVCCVAVPFLLILFRLSFYESAEIRLILYQIWILRKNRLCLERINYQLLWADLLYWKFLYRAYLIVFLVPLVLLRNHPDSYHLLFLLPNIVSKARPVLLVYRPAKLIPAK